MDYNGTAVALRIMYGRLYFLIQLFVFYIYGQQILLQKVVLQTLNQNAKKTEDTNIEVSNRNTQMVTVSTLTTLHDIFNKQNDVILPLENNSNIEKQMLKLIREFHNDNCLIIPYEKYVLDWILALTNVKTIIYPKSHMLLMEKLRQFDTYIAIIRTVQDLKHFLTMLHGTPNWSYKAKYLLIYLGSLEDMEEIFKITWKHYLLDITVLIHRGESFEMYTHFPYTNGSCGSNSIPVRLDEHSDIFPEKIDADLKGCEIRMMAVKIPPYVLDVEQPKDDPTKAGLEVTILHNVLTKMNFTEIYVPTPYPSWGLMLADGNFTMAFKSLYEREVDIVFGMIITNASVVAVFESTVCHIRGTTVWVVPTASEIAQWKNLTVIFDGIVWAAIFFVFILNGFAWWIIGRKRETSASYNELSLCLMGSLYILLQGSITTAKTWKLRLIVLLWSIASLLIYTAHQCQLTGILTSPLYEHQISSLKEMVESDLHYGIHPEVRILYSDPNNPVHREILNNHEECSLHTVCLNRTAFKRDFATIKNERQINYLMPISYTTPRGKPMLYMIHENAVLFLCKYLMSEGFPFLKRMDRLIMLLQDSGLVAKWENDLSPKSTVNDDSELEPLTLNHLQGAFFLLLFGYLASSCIFLAEKCYERFGHKKSQRD